MPRAKPFGGHSGSAPDRGPYDTAWKRPGGRDSNPLQAARHKLGLTQHQLADELGISRARIAQWESGARDLPRGDSAERYALNQFLERAGQPPLPEDKAHRCKICEREITDPESIARGIGPECALHTTPARKNRKSGR